MRNNVMIGFYFDFSVFILLRFCFNLIKYFMLLIRINKSIDYHILIYSI